jgi:hypothetical protein
MRSFRSAVLATAALACAVITAASCTDPTAPHEYTRTPLTDPVSAAALLPPSVRLTVPRDSVLTGDTLGGVTATATDNSGKIQNQARIDWTTHAVDSAPGSVAITPLNPKAQQVTLKGLARGRVMLVASYTDRSGQTARDSALFRVAPRVATIGICTIPISVADSLHFSGDTTADWGIVGQFCEPTTSALEFTPGVTTGLTAFGLGLDVRLKVRVHIRREVRR